VTERARTRRQALARPPSDEPDAARARELRALLLAWFDRERRDLPWRADRDAYRVWISEAMLQQTRVETVLPYYARFVARFPDVGMLAAAPVDDVLAAWSGLGYYRRARTLHAAARAVVELHGGQLPRTRAELLALPGVGPYTAGAVLSIAYDLREALVDGNVARVLARLFAVDGDPASSAFQERAWGLARALVADAERPGDWNQALMELGALVCAPREPDCARCPLAGLCAARATGRERELPRAKARAAPVDVELVLLVAERGDALLLERRPETGRMAGLWQLPTVERGSAARLAPSEWPAPARVVLGAPLGVLRHTITCHRIRAELVRATLASEALPPEWRWCARGELGELALTGLAKKALALRAAAFATPTR
jgi:A/G-specific adenine glycosylase